MIQTIKNSHQNDILRMAKNNLPSDDIDEPVEDDQA